MTPREILDIAAEYIDARNAAEWGTPNRPDLDEIAGRFGVALDSYVTQSRTAQAG